MEYNNNLNKNSKLITNYKSIERSKLLKEREEIIEKSINNIQESFILIGKALLEIKDLNLYKEDPKYNTWSSYIENRIKTKLHQSTISDYISIVRMILSNENFISEEDIIKLGYKKSKYLKSKYYTILKETDDKEREKKLNQFKSIYNEIINSPNNIPYKAYKEKFNFVGSESSIKNKNNNTLNTEINGIKISYNKNSKSIIIKSEQEERLKNIYYLFTKTDYDQENLPSPDKLISLSNNLAGFIREIPKTEIHLHIEALVSIESIFELIKKNNLHKELEIYKIEDVKKRFHCSNLEEMVQVFYLIQTCFKKEEDFAYLVKDVRNYLLRNNIYYAEIYFSPTKFIKNGLSFKKIINIIDYEIQKYRVEDTIDIKLIIDVSRNFGIENALNNLNLLLKHKTVSIIGIGLGGAEAVEGAEAEHFIEVFRQAKENGLHRVAHAGEVVGPESIWQTLKLLEVERIGHGISAIYDEKLMEYLKNNNIPLEICPTSNVFTQKFVKRLGEHPIKIFFDKGLNVTLNSDDPSIFNVDIVDEYENIYEHCGFTVNQIIQVVKNGLYSTFLSDNLKKVYWDRIKEKVKFLKEKYNIK